MKKIITSITLAVGISIFLLGCTTFRLPGSQIQGKKSSNIRTIITQDGEIDDQNSLIHFLLYTNEIDIQGIIQTSSKFHWIGVEGTVTPTKTNDAGEVVLDANSSFEKPYRWPGTKWMFEYLDAYEKVYNNLKEHDSNYPTPNYLRSITKVGNIGYEGEMEGSTDGSELIKSTILDNDSRILYLEAWGGTNTIAQALKDIEDEYKSAKNWDKIYSKIVNKIVITACNEQDKTYRTYIAENWPEIKFISTLQMGSYAYLWNLMPNDESKDTFQPEYMKKNLVINHGPLLDLYGTWADGKFYNGEEDGSQFGTNMSLLENWWGAHWGLGTHKPYEFISEGDSPTFFMFLNSGLRSLENPANGGFSGRYYFDETEKNNRGDKLNYWKPIKDYYLNKDGSIIEIESSWKYIDDIQNDFSARADWCITDSFINANHAPSITISEGVNIKGKAGDKIILKAKAFDPDGDDVNLEWSVYSDASTYEDANKIEINKINDTAATFTIPSNGVKNSTVHIIAQAKDNGEHNLTFYQQIIVTIE